MPLRRAARKSGGLYGKLPRFQAEPASEPLSSAHAQIPSALLSAVRPPHFPARHRSGDLGELKPSTHGPDTGFDKVLHFTAYFGLAGIATVALGRRTPAMKAAAGLAVFGGVMEIVQSFVGRDAEWGDEAANIAGACVGFIAGWTTVRFIEAVAAKAGGRREGENGPVR